MEILPRCLPQAVHLPWPSPHPSPALLTAPAPRGPCPALGRGWSEPRPAQSPPAWARGVAWGRRGARGAAGSRPRGGWAGCAAWSPPCERRCCRLQPGRRGSEPAAPPVPPSKLQGCWGAAGGPQIPGQPCDMCRGRQPEGGGQASGHKQRKPEFTRVRRQDVSVQGEQVCRAHSLSAWLPRPPKAALPRAPRPPKVLGLLKGSVGAAGAQGPARLPPTPSPAAQAPTTQPEGPWSSGAAPCLPTSPSPEVCQAPRGAPTCQVSSGQEAARVGWGSELAGGRVSGTCGRQAGGAQCAGRLVCARSWGGGSPTSSANSYLPLKGWGQAGGAL